MKRNFEYLSNFDLHRVKNRQMKQTALRAFYLMLLTLTPQLFMYYLRAIHHTPYKVAMKILHAIPRHYFLDPESHETPQVGIDDGQMLLEAIVYDMQRCMKVYQGGFLYGIIEELQLPEGSAEREWVKEFLVRLFTRLCEHAFRE